MPHATKEQRNLYQRNYNKRPEVRLKRRLGLKIYRSKNREKARKWGREYMARRRLAGYRDGLAWHHKNRDRSIERSRRWKESNRERVKAYTSEYYRKNYVPKPRPKKLTHEQIRERRRVYEQKWRDKNKEQLIAKRALRIDSIRINRRARSLERYKTDPSYYLAVRFRARIRAALKSSSDEKKCKSQELLGCPISHLKNHLESQFCNGMSWENRNLWHIDHIRPCASFDLSLLDQQKKCFHYTNLQPLWIKENLSKRDKWSGPND